LDQKFNHKWLVLKLVRPFSRWLSQNMPGKCFGHSWDIHGTKSPDPALAPAPRFT